jgi:large subunit ribosomal protein L29
MKATEIRDLTPEEITQKIDELKQELFNLRFQQATGNLENTAALKETRKTIARLKTVMNERSN